MGPSDRPATTSTRLSRLGLRAVGGWSVEGSVPDHPRAVMLAGPHTANKDGLLLVLVTRSLGMDARWMVKDTWTRWPIGMVTNRVGAVPISRDTTNGVVSQMVDEFERRERFHLMVPPEGTRSRAEHWKSGFYEIALEADVPVIPTYVDYRTKHAGFGPATRLTGDRTADMDVFREFYAEGAAMAKHPEKFGPIRLRDESAQTD